MNAHLERFNRTIQEEYIDYHLGDLIEPDIFNNNLIDYLLWYNTQRPHYAFRNKLSPVQYILSLPRNLKITLNYETILPPLAKGDQGGFVSPPFNKGRLGGISLKIHPNPPLLKEGIGIS